MPTPLSTTASCAVSDHEIYLFYETDSGAGALTYDGGPATLLGELVRGSMAEASAAGSLVPPRLRPGLASRYADAKVFDEKHDLTSGLDFHEHIADLASGRRRDLMKVFTLSPIAKRLITKGDLYLGDVPASERPTHQFTLGLSKAAASRLQAERITASRYRIAIEDVTVFLFRTQKGFTQVRVTVHPMEPGAISALELLEVQISLGRFHDLHWCAAGELPGADAGSVKLGALIQGLVVGPQASRAVDRVSTYTFMRFDDPVAPDDADRLAFYSARHYTGDYCVVPQCEGTHLVRHFDTVGHAVALEGACTIVAPSPERPVLPEFLATFKENTFRVHYLPLMLFALHEHAFLIDRAGRSVIGTWGSEATGALIPRLRLLLRDSLEFRLHFRFASVSYISMHNAVSQAFREALSLDKMLDDLSKDVAEIEAFLTRLREHFKTEAARQATEDQHERDRRYYFASVVGAASLAGLTTFTIVKEGAEVFHLEAGFYGFWAGVVLFAVACGLGYLKRPHAQSGAGTAKQGHGDAALHAAIEHMLHSANK